MNDVMLLLIFFAIVAVHRVNVVDVALAVAVIDDVTKFTDGECRIDV
jgi:hypothetical protein